MGFFRVFRAYRKRGLLAASLLGAALLAVSFGFFGDLLLNRNFHAVIPGELYRSAQPRTSDLARYRDAYGIRTIVNLRGGNPGAGWYDAEVAEASKLGMTHLDFRMSARRVLSHDQAAELVALLEKAPKPVLIHCNGGADRSGLVSALYVAAIGKLGEDAAEKQMSIRYGHISLPFSFAYPMDETFELLEPWLGYGSS